MTEVIALGASLLAAALAGTAVYQGALLFGERRRREQRLSDDQIIARLVRWRPDWQGLYRRAQLQLRQAGLRMPVEAYAASVVIVGASAGWLTGATLRSGGIGLLAGMVAAFLPRLWLTALAGRRRRLIRDAVPEVLRLWANLMASHRGQLRLALERSSESLPAVVAEPLSRMLHRLATEPYLDMGTAIDELCEELGNREIRLFLELAMLTRTKGADTTAALGRLADAAQSAADMRAEIAADLSGSITEGYFLLAAAVAVVFMMSSGASDQWELAMAHPSGWLFRTFIVGGLAGALWAQRQVTKIHELE